MILFNNGYLSNWYHSTFTINGIIYENFSEYFPY